MLLGPREAIHSVVGSLPPLRYTDLECGRAGIAVPPFECRTRARDREIHRLPGVPISRVRDIALSLHRGGVGYYPHSNFVHVDTGRVRQWCFECDARQRAGD